MRPDTGQLGSWLLKILLHFAVEGQTPRRMMTEVARPENDACSGDRCGPLVGSICHLPAKMQFSLRGHDEDADFVVPMF